MSRLDFSLLSYIRFRLWCILWSCLRLSLRLYLRLCLIHSFKFSLMFIFRLNNYLRSTLPFNLRFFFLSFNVLRLLLKSFRQTSTSFWFLYWAFFRSYSRRPFWSFFFLVVILKQRILKDFSSLFEPTSLNRLLSGRQTRVCLFFLDFLWLGRVDHLATFWFIFLRTGRRLLFR